MDSKVVLHHIKQNQDQSGLIDQYIALRNERYSKIGIPYDETEKFFDTHPDTEFVVAESGGKVVGGGRLVIKKPDSNFSLSLEAWPFEKIYHDCLAKAGINADSLYVVQVGGVATAESSDPTQWIGAKVQRMLSDIVNQRPNFVAISRAAESNSAAVARTVKRNPNMRTIIVPGLQYHNNPVSLFMYTNNADLYDVFNDMTLSGNALYPDQYIKQHSRKGR